MFIGVWLIVTWVSLLRRYRAKAWPVALAAAAGLGSVAANVIGQE
ncbi:multidrug transporter, partial [Pseudomonas syringae]|nr:multidrug transporter [Pseudomonas syringae]